MRPLVISVFQTTEAVVVNVPTPPLDFEANEQRINRRNLDEVAAEVAERSARLATRIQHFSNQSGIPQDDFLARP